MSTRVIDSRDLARLSDADWRLFFSLIALCGDQGIGDTITLSDADIAWRLRLDLSAVTAGIDRLSAPGSDGEPLVKRRKSGISLVKWDVYQPSRTEAERKREARDTRRVRTASGQRPDSVRAPRPDSVRSVSGRQPGLEVEVEGEVEEEGDSTHAQSERADLYCKDQATQVARANGTPRQAPATMTTMPSVGSILGGVLADVPGIPPVPGQPTRGELDAIAAAYAAGIGRPTLKLDYHQAERIAARCRDPERVRAVAARYAAGLSSGVKPSAGRFADAFGEWAAEVDRGDPDDAIWKRLAAGKGNEGGTA